MSSWLATRVGSPRMDRFYTVSERLDFALIVGYERVVITFLKMAIHFQNESDLSHPNRLAPSCKCPGNHLVTTMS